MGLINWRHMLGKVGTRPWEKEGGWLWNIRWGRGGGRISSGALQLRESF